MTDYTNIEAKLEEYAEAFDVYMNYGRMPANISGEDCLIQYIKEVIDNNPQLDISDPTWIDVLKDNLISYLNVLLEQFSSMQYEAEREHEMIKRFAEAPLEVKRQMWPDVKRTIENNYSYYEVNIEGYISQFKTEDRDAVFSALTDNWWYACNAKLRRNEQYIFEGSKEKFENLCQDIGTTDYERRKKIDNYFYKYPQLKTIVDTIGRDKEHSKEDMDSVTYKFMPAYLPSRQLYEELDRVELGDNLERVLPFELSMPDFIFFKRFVTKELQQFSCPSEDKPRRQEQTNKDPRLIMGPIIVCIDTSSSMEGRPMKIAFSVLKQLLSTAKKQKRACFLISFSVRSRSIDLSKPKNWNVLNHFIENGFSGGTNGEEMLAETISVLHTDKFEMADVLIISDLQFPAPKETTQKSIKKEQALGTKFYALQIGNDDHTYGTVFDMIWNI